MSVYEIDFGVNGLGRLETPVRLRTSPRLEWLAALLSGAKVTYEEFMANRADNLYVLAHNGQVCYLEAVLNDVFDTVDRGIYITDGPYMDPHYIYIDAELKWRYIWLDSELGPGPDDAHAIPLYTDEETYLQGIQFIVNVPAAVAALPIYDEHRLRALVDKYRLASKGYYSVVVV